MICAAHQNLDDLFDVPVELPPLSDEAADLIADILLAAIAEHDDEPDDE